MRDIQQIHIGARKLYTMKECVKVKLIDCGLICIHLIYKYAFPIPQFDDSYL